MSKRTKSEPRPNFAKPLSVTSLQSTRRHVLFRTNQRRAQEQMTVADLIRTLCFMSRRLFVMSGFKCSPGKTQWQQNEFGLWSRYATRMLHWLAKDGKENPVPAVQHVGGCRILWGCSSVSRRCSWRNIMLTFWKIKEIGCQFNFRSTFALATRQWLQTHVEIGPNLLKG